MLVSGVVLSQPMGGVRRHNAELLPRASELLKALGGELLVMEGREPISFELPQDIRRIPSEVPASPAAIRASFEGRALRHALKAEAAAGRSIDLVHLGHMPAPRSLPVPHTHTIHDLRLLQGEHTPMSRRLVSRHFVDAAAKGAALIITVSELVREQLMEQFDLPPERVRVVPNGCDHLSISPRRADPERTLLCVGHLEARKNVGLLIEALTLDRELGELVLVGAAKGQEQERLEELAASRGVAERVSFRGLIDDEELSRLYAECATCVFPSKLEGFGIGVAEAMRAGAPVAIARGTAMDEVSRGCCKEFDPNDAVECAAAIQRAIKSTPEELKAAEERSRAFAWDKSAEELVSAWCSAAAATAQS